MLLKTFTIIIILSVVVMVVLGISVSSYKYPTPTEALDITSYQDSVATTMKYLGIDYCYSQDGIYYVEWNNKSYDIVEVYRKYKKQGEIE